MGDIIRFSIQDNMSSYVHYHISYHLVFWNKTWNSSLSSIINQLLSNLWICAFFFYSHRKKASIKTSQLPHYQLMSAWAWNFPWGVWNEQCSLMCDAQLTAPHDAAINHRKKSEIIITAQPIRVATFDNLRSITRNQGVTLKVILLLWSNFH